MTTRYQVFVSSTYTDLKEERATVSRALLEVDCIPVGMELFPAVDQQQFDFIKSVIDSSDYYVLIIGGRYGSLGEAGVSYTEMEYEYAVSRKIPVFGFIHEDTDLIPAGKTEKSQEAQERLKEFRNKVATGRIVKFWKHSNELPNLVTSTITIAIRRTPGVGWVRGGSGSPAENLRQILDLKTENDALRKELSGIRSDETGSIESDLNRTLSLKYTTTKLDYNNPLSAALGNSTPQLKVLRVSAQELLKFIGLRDFRDGKIDFNLLIPEDNRQPNFQPVSFPSPRHQLTDDSIKLIKLAIEAMEFASFDIVSGKTEILPRGKRALLEILAETD